MRTSSIAHSYDFIQLQKEKEKGKRNEKERFFSVLYFSLFNEYKKTQGPSLPHRR
jgi:hypothetical protein